MTPLLIINTYSIVQQLRVYDRTFYFSQQAKQLIPLGLTIKNALAYKGYHQQLLQNSMILLYLDEKKISFEQLFSLNETAVNAIVQCPHGFDAILAHDKISKNLNSKIITTLLQNLQNNDLLVQAIKVHAINPLGKEFQYARQEKNKIIIEDLVSIYSLWSIQNNAEAKAIIKAYKALIIFIERCKIDITQLRQHAFFGRGDISNLQTQIRLASKVLFAIKSGDNHKLAEIETTVAGNKQVKSTTLTAIIEKLSNAHSIDETTKLNQTVQPTA